MERLNVEEATPLIPIDPTTVRDPRQPYEKQLSVSFILASTLFERIAFYTLSYDLVFTLDSDKVPEGKYPNGSTLSFIFSGTSYITTLIFAVLSDAKFGRARTILFGFLLYLIGYILVIVITNIHICNPDTSNHTRTLNTTTLNPEPCTGWFIGILIIIATGAGAVQSNMPLFGVEQIQESKEPIRYFDKHVVAVNIGSILAVWIIPSIQEDVGISYSIGYPVAASMLLVAALLFIIGHRYYIHVKPYDTVVTKCIPVLINAFQTWREYGKNKREEELIRIDEPRSTFLDFAKIRDNGKFDDRIVDDVKSLQGALVVFSLLIPYWLIYHQLSSTFSMQGKYMHGSDGKDMVTAMWLYDPVTIIIGILLLNMFVYKYLDARNQSFTITRRFIIGMCFAWITMCFAGTVEKFRQDRCDINYGNNGSSLSIYYQLPQHVLMGFSEIFVMVASFEFAYFAAPRSAQSLFMSLRFCSLGISSFIGSAYFAFFRTSSFDLDFNCPSPPNWRWSYYTYFFILASIQFLFIIIFIVCQKKFRIVKLNPKRLETN